MHVNFTWLFQRCSISFVIATVSCMLEEFTEFYTSITSPYFPCCGYYGSTNTVTEYQRQMHFLINATDKVDMQRWQYTLLKWFIFHGKRTSSLLTYNWRLHKLNNLPVIRYKNNVPWRNLLCYLAWIWCEWMIDVLTCIFGRLTTD